MKRKIKLFLAVILLPLLVDANTTLTNRYKNDFDAELELQCSGTAGPANLKGWLQFNVSTAAHAFPLVGYSNDCSTDTQFAMAVVGSNTQAGNEHWSLSLTGQASYTDRVTLRATVVRISAVPPGQGWQATTLEFLEFYSMETSTSTVSFN